MPLRSQMLNGTAIAYRKARTRPWNREARNKTKKGNSWLAAGSILAQTRAWSRDPVVTGPRIGFVGLEVRLARCTFATEVKPMTPTIPERSTFTFRLQNPQVEQPWPDCIANLLFQTVEVREKVHITTGRVPTKLLCAASNLYTGQPKSRRNGCFPKYRTR